MIIRQHQRFPGRSYCRWCGHGCDATGFFSAEATCVPHDDGLRNSELRPEPAIRSSPHDDSEAIQKTMGRDRADRELAMIVQSCAVAAGRPIGECQQCTAHCLACAVMRKESTQSCVICWDDKAKKSNACPAR